MKIIEALKQAKDLLRKADDIRSKVKEYCADLENQEPTYPDQKTQISQWLQAHSDIVKEIMRLRFCITKTNTLTAVNIVIGGTTISHTITEWIQRRKDLSVLEASAWNGLTNKGLTPKANSPTGKPEDISMIKIRLYYDAKQKDKMVELYKSEPALIDGALEVINATTDLIE